jgi:hypothetical protein
VGGVAYVAFRVFTSSGTPSRSFLLAITLRTVGCTVARSRGVCRGWGRGGGRVVGRSTNTAHMLIQGKASVSVRTCDHRHIAHASRSTRGMKGTVTQHAQWRLPCLHMGACKPNELADCMQIRSGHKGAATHHVLSRAIVFAFTSMPGSLSSCTSMSRITCTYLFESSSSPRDASWRDSEAGWASGVQVTRHTHNTAWHAFFP